MNDNHRNFEAEGKTALTNERENVDIVQNYNAAIQQGCDAWLASGGRGSMFESLKAAMVRNGVVRS